MEQYKLDKIIDTPYLYLFAEEQITKSQIVTINQSYNDRFLLIRLFSIRLRTTLNVNTASAPWLHNPPVLQLQTLLGTSWNMLWVIVLLEDPGPLGHFAPKFKSLQISRCHAHSQGAQYHPEPNNHKSSVGLHHVALAEAADAFPLVYFANPLDVWFTQTHHTKQRLWTWSERSPI